MSAPNAHRRVPDCSGVNGALAPTGKRCSGDARPSKRKTPEEPHGRGVALKREDDGSHWLLPEVEQSEATKQWPSRSRVLWDDATFELGVETTKRKRQDEEALEYSQTGAVAHFQAVQLDEEDGKVVEIELGNHVEILLCDDTIREDHYGVMEVTELFEDDKGDRWFGGHWFYKTVDTALAVKGEDIFSAIDKRRIFRASDYDSEKGYATVYALAAIHRKVSVTHITPGSAPPADTDYWWDMEHDRRFSTFKDVYPAGTQRTQHAADQPRVIRCADFYSGCGGLSFMDTQIDEAHITTSWAVDYCHNMTLSFRANYPETEVFKTGVDEWLKMCQYFAQLAHQYCPAAQPPSSGKKKCKGKYTKKEGTGDKSKQDLPAVEEITGLQLGDSARRGKSGQAKNCLLEPLTHRNSWLEVKLKREGQGAAWERLDEADVPQDLLAAFVREKRRTKAIPLPGDIDVVMGGPPCQGVSGLNRHSATVNILKDSRNRQVTAFYDVVEYFRPAYVLMENVLDILKKEDGTYAKSAMASLLTMRYQVRIGVIAACDHGVPQSRNRVFMWGAKSGEEQLPPFPEPTHRGIRNRGQLGDKQHLLVDFPSEAARQKALPVVVMGDILADLPAVTNFTFAESAEYATAAQSPLQLWLQRDPPSYQASRETRGQRAGAFMQEGHAALEKKIRRGEHDVAGIEKVGSRFACASHKQGQRAFAWNRLLRDCRDDEERELKQAEMDASIKALHYQTGQEVIGQFEAAKVAKGPVRDHRPLCLNLDDHIRVCSVVKAKASNFRSFPGVITHRGPRKDTSSKGSVGQCCVGHWHAAIDAEGKSSCPAGGHWQKPKRTNQKEGRVDNDNKEESFPGLQLEGCPAYTVWMPSGGLLCPRWTITYKDGRSTGRHGCFGVVWYDEVIPTVVGRAEPHNLALIHPEQDRVLTIRENARTQGFPDYFYLVGLAKSGKSWVRNESLTDRYQQMGNAVCPMVASALGRCLALAVVGGAPESLEQAVVSVPDPAFVQCLTEAQQMGLKYYVEKAAVNTAAVVAGGGEEATDDEDEEADPYLEDV